MSTTVYNGCKFPEGSDLLDIIQRFNEARPQAIALADRILQKQITAQAINRLDRLIVQATGAAANDSSERPDEYTSFSDILSKCFQRTLERRKSPDSSHHSDIDTAASIVVIPHATGLYGIFRCNNDEMLGYMKATLGFEDYGWWNNTDEPEGVTEDEWEARGKIWNEILDNEHYVSYLGPEMVLVRKEHDVPYTSPSGVMDFSGVRDFEKRVFDAAMETTAAQSDPPEQSAGMAVSHMMSLREGKNPAFEKVRERMRKVLIEFPDADLFKRNLSDVLDQARTEWEAGVLDEQSQPSSANRSSPRM